MVRRNILFPEDDYGFNKIILAIDPGVTGAFAWITPSGDLLNIDDMPIIQVNGKSRIFPAGVKGYLESFSLALVVIEQVQAMPRRNADGTDTKMGAVSTGSFFYGAGILEGVAIGLGLAVEIVHPRTWKSRAGVPADKGACRQMAQRFWPNQADKFKLKKHDGRADAALLGRWTALKMRGHG